MRNIVKPPDNVSPGPTETSCPVQYGCDGAAIDIAYSGGGQKRHRSSRFEWVTLADNATSTVTGLTRIAHLS